MFEDFRNNVKGDLIGGGTSSIVALPGNIVYGTIAFASLGPEYASHGVLAGMFSTVFASFFAIFFGGIKIMISGPQPPSAIVFGSLLGQLLALGSFNVALQTDVHTVLTLVFFTVLIAGIFQILFGILKFGTLVKYTPYPVIAGILTGTGFLILKRQIWYCLGVNKQGLTNLLMNPLQIKIMAIVISTISAVLMWKSKKWLRKIPPTISAVVVGTSAYYITIAIGAKSMTGPVIGYVPSGYPSLKYVEGFFHIFSGDIHIWQYLPTILLGGLTIAILSSMDTLLSTVRLSSLTNERANGNKELFAHGIGGVASAIFGGLPGGSTNDRGIINYQSGGRTKLSVIVHSFCILILIMFLPQLIGYIPKSVMAGIIIILALRLIDIFSFVRLGDIFSQKDKRTFDNELLLNASVVIIVGFVTFMYGLIVAVGVGIIISMIILIMQMGKGNIRRILTGDQLHSHKHRYHELTGLLEKHRNEILVIELQGSVFFGSADNLTVKLESYASKNIKYIILDMKRVERIDSTGCKVLCQSLDRIRDKRIEIIVSYLEDNFKVNKEFKDFGMYEKIGKSNFYDDTNIALEFCEDKILSELTNGKIESSDLSLNVLLGLGELDPESSLMIADYIERKIYRQGDFVFRQDEESDAVYFIAKGSAAVTARISSEGGKTEWTKQLQTLTFGTYFGLMALFGEKKRAEDVQALENLVCYKLNIEKYNKLKETAPALAYAILNTISRTMSNSLKHAYRTIRELES